jgi:hypothetical protein
LPTETNLDGIGYYRQIPAARNDIGVTKDAEDCLFHRRITHQGGVVREMLSTLSQPIGSKRQQ